MLFWHFVFVFVFYFFVLVLVFVNEFVIFSFFTIFVFVFVKENHTATNVLFMNQIAPNFNTLGRQMVEVVRTNVVVRIFSSFSAPPIYPERCGSAPNAPKYVLRWWVYSL